ncbi:MarR family transcriptional regulator [Shimia sp. R11_0]|uniref:MarR family winged helix-turn-helix transcriptional regulator n=1 Tax=Shimia sp. R11_0 TaxID=2821096 RepID=UPI001ADCAD1F|nr:MarR family transcriptional regulator [Shimia sp. R11_0]MBO9478808.1 MarR family transcriptional regulator [Shimia sp. R11_0]
MTKSPKIFLLMNRAHAAMTRAVEQKTQALAGLSMPQLGVLALLSQKDGQAVSDMAQALSMRKSSLSGLIDRMVERGFVRRVRGAEDGRVVWIFLEPSARDLVRRVDPLVRTANARLLDSFTEAEQATIGRFLMHMADQAEEIIAAVPVSEQEETE